jgi:XTP/dITP diphosphohydrolase
VSERAEVLFATSNKGKVIEAQLVVEPFGITLKPIDLSKREIQSDDLREIAEEAAFSIAREKLVSVLVEDSGLFINALNGFPGPYSAYVYRTVGIQGILDLLKHSTQREAQFRAAAAYCRPNERPHGFAGFVNGIITEGPRGSGGFGFDPIFAPNENRSETFAEMTAEEKNRFSHRSHAFREFAEWFRGARNRSNLHTT